MADVRSFCGEIDPFIPGEFTGTDLGYTDAVRQAAQSLEAVLPGNPVSKYLLPLTVAAPFVCSLYDCVYDLATGSGEYYDIVDILP